MEMYNKINVVFMPTNTTSILQSNDQGETLIFRSYLRQPFCEAITAINSDSSDECGQIK